MAFRSAQEFVPWPDKLSMGKTYITQVDIYLNGKPEGIVFGMKINENRDARKPFLYLTGLTDTSTFTPEVCH